MQHPATHCNTLQHTAAHFIGTQQQRWKTATELLQLLLTASHCNTLQHTAKHCKTLQYTATHCNTLQHAATHCKHCNTIYRTSSRLNCGPSSRNSPAATAADCNTLQHTAIHFIRAQLRRWKPQQRCCNGCCNNTATALRAHQLKLSNPRKEFTNSRCSGTNMPR